ncbi:hypothetical protein [Streptomyces sp. NRRL F-5053]|uniref:hypothetical protein n=1 Tax=Streptomyces sp. NRRL F-5053 TaxID=1463854 RepID=UPI0004C9D5B4|nr:hypothetical protein [Streptomyces sp. NRRL F-5053]
MTIPRDLYADSYYGVPVVMDEEGECLLTHDLRRAWAALNRFHRTENGTSARDYWADNGLSVRDLTVYPTWLRPASGDPDWLWRTTTDDDPQAVPAIYIGA